MNTTLTLPKVLILIALICFVLTAVGVASLVAVGLAFWAGAALIS